MAERIDALSANPYQIAQMKRALSGAAARSAMRLGDNRMIALAEGASLSGEFFQAIDADQPFDKDFHQFDEKSELLNGYDQRVVLLAQMAFHELRRLPFHQLALGGFGAAFRFRTLRSDFLKFDAAVRPGGAGARTPAPAHER